MKEKLFEYTLRLGVTFLLLLWLHLFLKLSWTFCLPAGAFFLFMEELHLRRKKEADRAWEKLEDIFLYTELLLHAFSREQKISRALEALLRGLPEGQLRALAGEALQGNRNGEAHALEPIETAYPESHLLELHRFMQKVEYYGGEVQGAAMILLLDKNRWEQRLRKQKKQRKALFIQVCMSCAASLLICGIVMYMPIQGMDISGNVIVQSLTLVLLVTDDLILYKAQKYLIMNPEASGDDGADRVAMLKRYRDWDEKKELRNSVLLAALPAICAGYFLYRGRTWLFAVMITLCAILLGQHRMGHRFAGRKLKEEIEKAFPQWLLSVALLLQGDNVHTAIEKSISRAPAILQQDLQLLSKRLELDPEGAGPYHRFLNDFELPGVRASMCSLYDIACGSSTEGRKQLQDLVEADLDMLDNAQAARQKDMDAGLYLLFLLPVLTASFKLVVDMSIFLIGFLSKGFI